MDLFENPPTSPLEAFAAWMVDAEQAGEPQPAAMALATATSDGHPSVRYVLYKGLIEGALVFYTNHDSRKGRELLENPQSATVFYWRGLRRQIRVEGPVNHLDAKASARYFQSRPRDSQISALASHQSQPIENRAMLESRAMELEQRYAGQTLPTPAFWGGYRLVPKRFEFWAGRSNRLHDRLAYALEESGWHYTCLSP